MSRLTTPSALLNELAELRRERNRLRDAATRRHAERSRLTLQRIVERAQLDALTLITVHIGGGHPGRAYSPLPARRWAYAAALLRLAHLARPGRDLCIVLPPEPEATFTLLQRAALVAHARPERYAPLVAPSLRPALLSRHLHRM